MCPLFLKWLVLRKGKHKLVHLQQLATETKIYNLLVAKKTTHYNKNLTSCKVDDRGTCLSFETNPMTFRGSKNIFEVFQLSV